MDKKRAAVYCRCSSEESADSGLSIAVQEDACRKAAEAQGFNVVEVFRDEGFSAFSDKPRPAYVDLMSRLHELDAIFVWKLDRFGRRQKQVLAAIDIIMEASVQWFAATESYDVENPMGWAMFSNAAMFAELSSRMTSARVKPALEEAATRGRTIAAPPFGYMLPAPKAIIVPDPNTAHIARSVFVDYAGGATVVSICRWLQEQGVKTTRGNDTWMPQTIMGMLRCHTYRGKVLHNGKVHEGLHEALIDEQTWWACHDRVIRNRLVHPRSRNGSLSSLMACGYCGATLVYHGWGKYYYCKKRTMSAKRHEPISIRRYIVEGYIWMMVERMTLPDADAVFRKASAETDQPDVIGRLTTEQRELEQLIRYNLRAAREADLPIHLLAEENRPLQDRLHRIADELEEIRSRVILPDQKTMTEEIGRIRSLGYGMQREYLSRLFDRIVVYRDHIRFVSGDDEVSVVRQRFHGRMPKELTLDEFSG